MAIPLKYNGRSLLMRRVSNAMTAGGIALVVAVFVVIMAMVAGLSHTIQQSSSDDNLIILARGSTTETASSLRLDQFEALKFLTAIRRDSVGNPLASPELAEQILMPSPGGSLDNLAVRGLLPVGLQVHDQVHVISGRMFTPGLSEVIIGKSLIDRYPGCKLGSTLRFGRRSWQVVGVFEAGGSSFESEVWGDVHSLQEDANRGTVFNGVRMKLAQGADVGTLIQRIADDPRIDLQAETEADYYRDQSAVANQVRALGLLVAGIMALGAVFAAMNTLYAAVSSRTTEIATLRAMGFRPRAILLSFLTESLVLALSAGAFGVLLALPINLFSTSFNAGLTAATLEFDFRVTFSIVLEALLFAAVMGVAGGYLPARRAMHMSVAAALRRI
jgi:ABC-type lipoprotein release transport system permease subunit